MYKYLICGRFEASASDLELKVDELKPVFL